jgi:hypothetical protein
MSAVISLQVQQATPQNLIAKSWKNIPPPYDANQTKTRLAELEGRHRRFSSRNRWFNVRPCKPVPQSRAKVELIQSSHCNMTLVSTRSNVKNKQSMLSFRL